METQTACPDVSCLSSFLDHELEEEEAKHISQHLETCRTCQTQVERMRHGEEKARRGLIPSIYHLRQTPVGECLSSEVVATYVRGLLPREEERQVETHLQSCDVCLIEVYQASRSSASLSAVQKESVPAARQTQEAAVALSRLVVQIAHEGLRLLEQHLAPPLLGVQEVLVPLPASRAAAGSAPLNLQLATGHADISITAIQEGKGIALTVALVGSRREGLGGQRISLRQHGRSLFSAKTDTEGVLLLPRLEPGLYEVTCPEIQATFQLELRL